MSIEEIEAAIVQLPREQQEHLADWFAELQARLWDEQIEADIRAGRLDRLANDAKQDFADGKCTPI
jgi:hypothetical protein